MKISVCIDAVYHGKDFVESLEEVAALGGKAFEFWSWWDKDIEQIEQAKERLGLTAVSFATRFISLVDPNQRDPFLQGLRESIAVAKQIGCSKIIAQTGNDLGSPRSEQQQSLIDGLKASAPLVEAAGIELIFEPLNILVDHPGYYLTHSAEAFDIVDAVNSPNVKVVFDIYHQQITEGNVIRNIVNNIHKIGHFHAAGNPGRHELYYGELNYAEIFRAIEATGYAGYMGLEYFPLDPPRKGLQKLIVPT